MKYIRVSIALHAVVIFAGVLASCTKSNDTVPKNCVVKHVKNVTPLLAGDTLVLETQPGTILLNVPTLSKTGSTFSGWFTDQSMIAASAFDLAKTPIYLDKTLYAKWK